jgi:hypothetical protein
MTKWGKVRLRRTLTKWTAAGAKKSSHGSKELPTDEKKAETKRFGLREKIWRQPTLAEAIQPLPSARLRLTAVFGMGTGRTTAS